MSKRLKRHSKGGESSMAPRGKGAAKEGGSQREVRRTFRILREV